MGECQTWQRVCGSGLGTHDLDSRGGSIAPLRIKRVPRLPFLGQCRVVQDFLENTKQTTKETLLLRVRIQGSKREPCETGPIYIYIYMAFPKSTSPRT